MLNQVILVGRLTKDVQVNKKGNGKEIATMTLAVPRSFKNMDGVYETDFINCTIWGGVAQNTSEYCSKGDIIGVKGRMQSHDNKLEVVAEKVTFLSKSKEDKKEQLNEEKIENEDDKEEDYEM